MAEGNRRQDQVQAAAESMRRGVQQATREAGRTGAEIVSRAGKGAAQQGDAALEATARLAGETMSRGAVAAQHAGAEVARRTEAAGTAGRELVQETVQQAAQAMDQGTGEAGAAMRPAMAGMAALPQAFAGLLGDMARTNWQIGQEMLRLANPVALIELQQRMLRGYLDLILTGQATLDRTARTAEAAMPDDRGH